MSLSVEFLASSYPDEEAKKRWQETGTCTGDEGLTVSIWVLQKHLERLRSSGHQDALTIASLEVAIAAMQYIKHKHPEMMKEEISLEKS